MPLVGEQEQMSRLSKEFASSFSNVKIAQIEQTNVSRERNVFRRLHNPKAYSGISGRRHGKFVQGRKNLRAFHVHEGFGMDRTLNTRLNVDKHLIEHGSGVNTRVERIRGRSSDFQPSYSSKQSIEENEKVLADVLRPGVQPEGALKTARPISAPDATANSPQSRYKTTRKQSIDARAALASYARRNEKLQLNELRAELVIAHQEKQELESLVRKFISENEELRAALERSELNKQKTPPETVVVTDFGASEGALTIREIVIENKKLKHLTAELLQEKEEAEIMTQFLIDKMDSENKEVGLTDDDTAATKLQTDLELMTNAKNEAEIMAKYLMKQLEVLQQQVEGGDVAVPDAKGLDYEIGYVGKEEPNIDYEEGNAGGEGTKIGDDQEHVEVDAAKEKMEAMVISQDVKARTPEAFLT